MSKKNTFAQKVLQFDSKLSNILLDLPEGYQIINPFNGNSKHQVKKIITLFYNKFYDDSNKRYMILGSSPARRGTAITGIPYEDAYHLQKETGIFLEDFYINKASSNFLYDVIEKYGGCQKFYGDFYMNFVCPLGIFRTNSKGNNVNCNYYDNKRLKSYLYTFIIESIKEQLSFNIDTSVCFCIGSGENYRFLCQINEEYHFFQSIIPLEHPRFIMQYNLKDKDLFIEKYLYALKNKSLEEKKEQFYRKKYR